ncbi:MAG: family 43 glycosylhydrolase [Lachnospiraceae bacterium]|nr:family 43 glycosylhydrolase [Lachnospiraceae bacterium]
MKKQVFNPYLPSWEYIPDGEPRVFGDRVYVYGSHDCFNAPIFCVNDYVCWSAPVEDLSDWRYEGVIFKKNQDPKNKLGLRLLFAPDVVQGKDGKYYLYYAFDFYGMIGVAVCDTPAGKYEFYGWVSYGDGTIWGRKKGDQFPFDPGVLVDDDGRVFLYSGFYTPCPAIASGFRKLKNDGGVVAELSSDMKTIISEPKLLFPKEGPGAFENHEFFEASSIRKDGDRYIFVYSSRHNHELCYAVSKYPDKGFTFGGTLVDLGDLFMTEEAANTCIFYDSEYRNMDEIRAYEYGNTDETKAANYLGNTHGGMLELKGQWYIFYHRHTNRHGYSRQACAERLVRTEDGRFLQAEVTSCGLNGKPLKDEGCYEARIACNLWGKEGTGRYDCSGAKKAFRTHPYFTQTGKDRTENGDQYIANMRDGAVAGFKYFQFATCNRVKIRISGTVKGTVLVSDQRDFRNILTEIPVEVDGSEKEFSGILPGMEGVKPLYFQYRGKGAMNFHSFELCHE